VSSRPAGGMSLEAALRTALRLVAPATLRDLAAGQGQSVRVVVGALAVTVSASAVAPPPAAGALFENPVELAPGELPADVVGKRREVFEAVAALRAAPGGEARAVRRRHIVERMREASGEEQSDSTVSHALRVLVGRGFVAMDRHAGYRLPCPKRAFRDKARSESSDDSCSGV
jgi:DNA-binding transcriptional ArsR family regulator